MPIMQLSPWDLWASPSSRTSVGTVELSSGVLRLTLLIAAGLQSSALRNT